MAFPVHRYTSVGVVGHGSFGVVCQGKILATEKGEGEDVAIKKVLQDKRFKVCPYLSPLAPRAS